MDTQKAHDGKPVSPKDTCVGSEEDSSDFPARGSGISSPSKHDITELGVHEITYINCEIKVTALLFCDSIVIKTEKNFKMRPLAEVEKKSPVSQ